MVGPFGKFFGFGKRETLARLRAPNLRGTMVTAQASETTEKPRVDAYYSEVPSQPCGIAMFGASGDLAQRKLLPALYDLAFHACLAPRFRLVGFSRTKMDDAEFRRKSAEALTKAKAPEANDNRRGEFLEHLH